MKTKLISTLLLSVILLGCNGMRANDQAQYGIYTNTVKQAQIVAEKSTLDRATLAKQSASFYDPDTGAVLGTINWQGHYSEAEIPPIQKQDSEVTAAYSAAKTIVPATITGIITLHEGHKERKIARDRIQLESDQIQSNYDLSVLQIESNERIDADNNDLIQSILDQQTVSGVCLVPGTGVDNTDGTITFSPGEYIDGVCTALGT